MVEQPMLSREAIAGFDLLSLPVWVFSVNSLQIRASNRAAQVWLGYDSCELEALTIADLRPATDRDRIVERVRQLREMRTDAGNWTIVAKSGAQYVASFAWHRVIFEGEDAILASIRDMTQVAKARERAQALTADLEQLRHQMMLTEEHFSRLFEAAPGKMMVLSAEGDVIVAATDEYAQAVKVEREAIIGRGLFDAFPDDPAEPRANGSQNLRASLQRVKALHATDVMNPQRYPIRTPDGSFEERFWLPMNKPVFDRAGQLIYIIHRVEDVTDLIRQRETTTKPARDGEQRSGLDAVLPVADARSALLALKERETRLRTAELLLNLVSWEHDPERGTLSWSPLVYDMYGLTPADMPADIHAYSAIVHPEDRAGMVEIYTRFIETRAATLTFQHRLLRKDGAIMHVRGVGARHQIDGRDIVIGHVQDLTRLMEIEARLQEATRLQRMAGQMAKVGGWRVDLERDRVIWSPETTAIHGVAADFVPSVAQAADFFVPADRPRIRAAFQTCAEQGLSFGETMQIVSAEGRTVAVRVTGEAVRSANGTIVAIEGAFQDISELVEATERSEHLSRRLLQTLDSISDAFFLLDRDWCFSFLNGEAARLLQRDRDSLQGQNVWLSFPEAVGSTFELEYRRAVDAQQTVRFREYFEPLNTWFEVNAYPTPEGLAVYFRD
ncbi:MAG: PAS domain S-box protein, partial [Rhodobacterales bacterium]|nr:PAS domain S-box protein [Rhodobacterales bacterium]MDX5500977.1 PAS domain S-box protein [Rhodobacterales bacterium]